MFCPRCGAQLPTGTRICTNCGSPLTSDQPQMQGVPRQQGMPQRQVAPQQQGPYQRQGSPYNQAGMPPNQQQWQQPRGDEAMAQMARRGVTKAVSGAQTAVTGIVANASISIMVCIALVLLLAFVSPWLGSPLYKAVARVAAQESNVGNLPKSITATMPQIVGTAGAARSLDDLSSLMGGSLGSGSGVSMAGLPPAILLTLYLVAWLVVAAILGICVEKFLAGSSNLIIYARIALGLELALCAIWTIGIISANNTISAIFKASAGSYFIQQLETYGISPNTPLISITFWTILAIIIAAAGLAISFVAAGGLPRRGISSQAIPGQPPMGQQPMNQQRWR